MLKPLLSIEESRNSQQRVLSPNFTAFPISPLQKKMFGSEP